MTLFEVYFSGLLLLWIYITLPWLLGIYLKNASIMDIFRGLGFVMFGDAAVWWGFALFSVAAGTFLPVMSAVLMSWLLIGVSGVSMLEKSLKNRKPGFDEYVERTSAFLPWIPNIKNVS